MLISHILMFYRGNIKVSVWQLCSSGCWPKFSSKNEPVLSRGTYFFRDDVLHTFVFFLLEFPIGSLGVVGSRLGKGNKCLSFLVSTACTVCLSVYALSISSPPPPLKKIQSYSFLSLSSLNQFVSKSLGARTSVSRPAFCKLTVFILN